ncbi:MAG: 2-hydroxyacid dehydrogenase [Candidatus Nanopelagicales bacterium]|nr:2-hydroxyacid dehydrogenase [Candidatus Nanopelagicales bacterium]MDZ4250023.1 2-hydroxyacid dehydrogenase [Candidatus Nanopelagicales bacterium]
MRIAVFGTKPYDVDSLTVANEAYSFELRFIEARLTSQTAELARGCDAVCVFVNDHGNERVLKALSDVGVKYIALRCAGFDRLNVEEAHRLGLKIVRVPSYSPHAIAEHTVALLLCLDRKIHRAYNRVREGNFALNGLLGWDLYGKTVGLIGTGNIGYWTAKAFKGFGCDVLAYDLYPTDQVRELGVEFVSHEELLARSDAVSLHVPLLPSTIHLMDAERIAMMKRGAILVNTSRGGLINTQAAIDALMSGQLSGLAIDVYEGEGDLFFEDRSSSVHIDPKLSILVSLPNVLVTAHQAFFTREALANIAEVTMENLAILDRGENCPNEVLPPKP